MARGIVWKALIAAAMAGALSCPTRTALRAQGKASAGKRATGTGKASKLSLNNCSFPTIAGSVQCGSYEVYENRGAGTGRKIKLHIVVLKALEPAARAEPVFWLAGGPGAAATASVDLEKDLLKTLRKEHDLVFLDQRGTGQSNALQCDFGDASGNLEEFFGSIFPVDKVRECRQKLEQTADLTQYTTPIAMEDLDEMRGALGYSKINIVAGSYGTIAAQVFLRQHPESVRAAFLIGVATPGAKQPLLFARAAQHALQMLFEDCAADQLCRESYPNLKAEFAALLERFERGAVEAQMLDPKTKQRVAVKLPRDSFVERIRLLLYTTTYGRFVPLVIHRAFLNDYVPFEELALWYNPGASLARGMYMTVTCSEGIPFISEEEIRRESEGSFVGEERVRRHREACRSWPQGNVPKSHVNPVQSDLPVLLISGELDGSSPPWFGEGVVKSMPNARQVKIRYLGHQVGDPCVWSILDEFVRKGSTKELDISCTEKIRRPPFATEVPRAFALE